MKGQTHHQTECETATVDAAADGYTLMLLNDDVNTFDYVIENLMEYCKHTYEQALQCAWITHCFGKCDILHGSLEKLNPIATILSHKGLTVQLLANIC